MAPRSDPSSARDEAERLVATVLAMARRAGNGGSLAAGLGAFGPITDVLASAFGQNHRPSGGTAAAGSPRFATGDAECCVCPICRAMVALRDPSPEFAERLATGAGDFAAGVASLLRALNSSGVVHRPEPEPEEPPRRFSDEEIWRAATRTRDDVAPARADGDVWAQATAGVRPPASPPAARPAPDDEEEGAPPVRPPRKPMARKAVKRTAPPAPRSDGA